MDRSNHYEAAFEAYLRHHGLCYLAVDEAKRASWGGEAIKSLDFIVHGPNGEQLLVDVKGRRFPMGPPHRPRRVWECWSTRDDIAGLERWTALFGPGYRGLLVFVYHLSGDVLLPEGAEDHWLWNGRRYLFRAIPVVDYRRQMRVRSPRWGTVTLPGAVYRALARPFRDFAWEAARAGNLTGDLPEAVEQAEPSGRWLP
ncbi:MAG: HYExAFE family protein [Gemmataceae bacterium]|nr:HYExAFE family protein [Gemmataceae bacterium]MDW8265477.1 HYExAFE family protein [Gemmataceae bacterium]